MVLFLPVHMHGKGQVLAGLEKMQFFFEQQGIGAEVDILFPRHEPFHNPGDLRVHQGLAARDGYHWRAAFVHGPEAVVG